MRILLGLIAALFAACQTAPTPMLQLGDAFALASLEFDS